MRRVGGEMGRPRVGCLHRQAVAVVAVVAERKRLSCVDLCACACACVRACVCVLCACVCMCMCVYLCVCRAPFQIQQMLQIVTVDYPGKHIVCTEVGYQSRSYSWVRCLAG
jgi:hypothetical protein